MRWIAALPAAALCAAAQLAAPAAGAQTSTTAPASAPAPAPRPDSGPAAQAAPGAAPGVDLTRPAPGPFGAGAPALSLPDPSLDADAQARARAADSARCQALVETDPAAAREVAREWGRRGGGVPAAVCEALALEAQGALATAAARLEDAARRAPEEALPDPARAALWEVAAGFRLRALQPTEALAAADAGLALEGAGPVLRRERGEALAALGRDAEALAELDAALEAMPRDLPGLRLRARLRGEAGDLAGALADAGRVAALDDRDPEVWLALGEAQAAAGRKAEARESLLRAIARDREGPVGDRARRALQMLDAPGSAPAPAPVSAPAEAAPTETAPTQAAPAETAPAEAGATGTEPSSTPGAPAPAMEEETAPTE